MRRHLRRYAWFTAFLALSAISYYLGFEPGVSVSAGFAAFFVEMVTFIPLLFILIGLFDVWFPKEEVERHVGCGSGAKGVFFVVLLAMLQAGPLYGAFPVAYVLYKKGASARNIFIYLGAFSTMKLPMIGLEVGYLGLKFTLLRTMAATPLFILIGYLMDSILGGEFEVKEVSAYG